MSLSHSMQPLHSGGKLSALLRNSHLIVIGAPMRDIHGQRLLLIACGYIIRHCPVQSGIFNKLANIPATGLKGSLNKTLIVRQN